MSADKVTVRLDPMTVVGQYFTEELLHDRIWEAAAAVSEMNGLDPLENVKFPELYLSIKQGFDHFSEFTGHLSTLGALTLTSLLDTGLIAMTIGPDETDEEHMEKIIRALVARVSWAMYTTLASAGAGNIGLVTNEELSRPGAARLREVPFVFRFSYEKEELEDGTE